MSELVTLRHPKLPAEQVIQVDRRRIGARLAAGWEEVVPEAPHSKLPDTDPEKPKRPRRQTSEDKD